MASKKNSLARRPGRRRTPRKHSTIANKRTDSVTDNRTSRKDSTLTTNRPQRTDPTITNERHAARAATAITAPMHALLAARGTATVITAEMRKGKLDAYQRGRPVEVSRARGPIRLRAREGRDVALPVERPALRIEHGGIAGR